LTWFVDLVVSAVSSNECVQDYSRAVAKWNAATEGERRFIRDPRASEDNDGKISFAFMKK
jgi:hypothetical protein